MMIINKVFISYALIALPFNGLKKLKSAGYG